MMDYKPEGLGLRADHMNHIELSAALSRGAILESTALAFDHLRRLRFELDGKTIYMPYEECALNAGEPDFRDVALLTRVGQSTCFSITDSGTPGQPPFISRRIAQLECQTHYLNQLVPGDILPCVVTHLESFGAFCDVGCGISALLPIDCLSVSRIQSPADRVKVGQQIFCVLKSRDELGRLVLSLKELMGTWLENAECFTAGETVVGIVRTVESYGVFIEIAPNLTGLAELSGDLVPGQAVSVYIKSILPEKMKVKLAVISHQQNEPVFFGPRYFVQQKHMDQWLYSPAECQKQISTYFC